jgi:hypothetical protein
VTFEEGLRVLSVDRQSTPEQARRAYLRLVKQHKPDRDPEGFKRVREAYECVSTILGFIEQAEAGSVTAPAAEANGERAVETGAQEAASNEEVVAEADGAEPAQALLEPYLTRIAALPRNDGGRGAIAIWKEAVRDHPDSVSARHYLYESYRTLRWRPEAAEVALEGYEHGMEFFAHQLLAFHAKQAPPELMDRAASRPELRALLPLAHVERGELAKAAEVMEALLKEACGRDETAYVIPVVALQIIAFTASGGEARLARRLIVAFGELLANAPSEARLIPGPLAARWAILREAHRLREKLPEAVFAAMAEATVPDRTEAALQHLLSWASDHSYRAPRIVKLLQTESPELHGAFGPHLSPVPQRTLVSRRSGWHLIWPGILAMQIIRFCTMAFEQPKAHTDSIRTNYARETDFRPPSRSVEGEPVVPPEPAAPMQSESSEEEATCEELGRKLVDVDRKYQSHPDDRAVAGQMKDAISRFMAKCRKGTGGNAGATP